ncbi:TIGR03619 family F420-dependent LLM class oxidoreductase [Nocardia sp. 348MFTsu5.1]|uniref:TIGR03619 family F420-dependent LLM class oxidoreductase n=1 Tax=Nocardia sp. 348MFTsu5.1 TaxID=1172185 RepID=UPI00048BA717|nr:TIGR03619 family F420-dependent LLM class oxidoreductase [Nocardia sp. 348MFTsu5.1]
MRFTFAEAMTDLSFYAPLAKAAEAAGYEGFVIPDSIAYPEESDSTYPYTADGGREFLEDKAFVETFVMAAALGAVTEKIRFIPFVLKLPVRPPALVAKQAMSVAVLTCNRFALGVGTSPWPEDYDILGVDFKRRGRRMDECMDIVRGLSTGEYFEFHGDFYDIPKIKMNPAPTKPIPLLVGGHADQALERAVIRGDGWMHGGGPPEELDALLDKIYDIRKAEGKLNDPFEIHAGSPDAYTAEGCKRLEEKGITDVIVGFRSPYIRGRDTESLQKKVDSLEMFAESVISKVNR